MPRRRAGEIGSEGAPRASRDVPAPRWLDLLPEPAALLDAEGRVLHVSEAFARWAGRPAAAVRGTDFLDLVAPEDRPLVDAAVRSAGSPDGAGQIDVGVAGDATKRVELLFAAHLDVPALRGVIVTLRDQSARHAAERLLAESQLRLDFALWGTQVGFWDMDVVRDETRWLGNWCESLDIEPCTGEDHVAKWDASIHPDDLPAAKLAFDRGLAGTREYYEAEYRVATRGGAWRWVRERGRVVERDAGGRALRMVGICVDIDAHKRTEERLRSVEAWHDLALEAAQMPVWEWDVGAGRLRIERPRQPALVEPRFERVHPDDVHRLIAAVARRRHGHADELVEVEYRVRTPHGAWKWVVDRGRIERSGPSGAMVVRGVTIDIDDRKRLEAAVLDAVNREQQRMGRDLHDGLSQDLTGASLLLASTLQQLVKSGHPAAAGVQEAIAVIDGAIETGRRIAQGLSSLTTLHGGLDDALRQLAERLAAASGLPIRVATQAHGPIRLDAVQVEHVYRIAQEGLTNALKHARASAIAMELYVGERELRVAVIDDGVGIGPAPPGDGLGTRIMKYRADALGARLRIERQPPHGTVVECVCPNGAGARFAPAPVPANA